MKIKAKQLPDDCGVTNGKIYDVLDKYEHGYLITSDDGFEVKIHRKNCEVINGHPHADLIMKYAEIAQHDAEPWKYFEELISGRWCNCQNHLCFYENLEYRLKPRTININGFEVPEPLRHELSNGFKFYSFDLYHGVLDLKWDSSDVCDSLLKAGLIHLTREAAEKHLEALLSFTKECE